MARPQCPSSPLQAAAWGPGRCSAPTWCGTAPPWRSACISRGRRPPRLWTGCRRTLPTAPRCSWGGERGDGTTWRASRQQGGRLHPEHLQLWGEECVEHRHLQARGPEHEDVPQHIEDQAAVWPGADESGFQEGGPFLLQGPQAALVPLKPQQQDVVGREQIPCGQALR